MNEIRETRSRKGVRLFSRLAEVFEAVQDYIGRTLKSLLVCNPSEEVRPYDGFLSPAYLSFEVFTGYSLQPIPRDSAQWWMWRYSLLSRAVPMQAKFYYGSLKNAFRNSLDRTWNMPYFDPANNRIGLWGADEHTVYVPRYPVFPFTFLDRMCVVNHRFRVYCDTACSVDTVLLRALLDHDDLAWIVALPLNHPERNVGLLNLVNTMPGDYADIDRLRVYGMVVCAMSFMHIANSNVYGDYMRHPFHFVETVLEFIMANPDFIHGLEFFCIRDVIPIGIPYLRTIVKFRKPGTTVWIHHNVTATVPDTGMFAKFQQYLDNSVRCIRDGMYPLDPCLAPKPLVYVDDLEADLRRKKKKEAERKLEAERRAARR